MARRCALEGLELARTLTESILEHKGHDIMLMDLSEKAAFADFFLLCSSENERQLDAIAQAVAKDARQKAKVRALGTEGEANGGWILIDFGDLVVHIFSSEMRAYYDLEHLWHEARIVMSIQ